MDERTCTVPLTRGLVAVVDAADYEAVISAGKWHAVPAGDKGDRFYAMRCLQGRRANKTALHAFLTGWPLTDHINGDGLDNRRANLRPATTSQNMANRGPTVANRSGYLGVSWAKQYGRWYACIKVQGKSMNLGYYDTPEEAARAYDAAAVLHFGEFAHPNFSAEQGDSQCQA